MIPAKRLKSGSEMVAYPLKLSSGYKTIGSPNANHGWRGRHNAVWMTNSCIVLGLFLLQAFGGGANIAM